MVRLRWGWTLCCHALLHSQCLSSWVQSGGVEVRCPTESDDTYSKAIAKHRCPKCNSPMPTSRVLQFQPSSASGLPPDVMDLPLAVTQLDTTDPLLPPTLPNTAGSCRDIITMDGDFPKNTLDSSNIHTDPASNGGSSCDGPGNQPECNHRDGPRPQSYQCQTRCPRSSLVAMKAHPDTDPLMHPIAACSSRMEQLSRQHQSGSLRYMLGFSYLPQVSTPSSFWRWRILAITFSVSLVEPHQTWSSAASFNRPAG